MNLIPVLADILSSTQREKVTRIILALFRVSTCHLWTECLNIFLLCSVNFALFRLPKHFSVLFSVSTQYLCPV